MELKFMSYHIKKLQKKEIFCFIMTEARRSERSVVEMPGVEPGSNVYVEGLYDHVPSVFSARQEGTRRGRER